MPSIIKKLSGRTTSNKPIELLSPKPFVPPRPLPNGDINKEIHQEISAAAANASSGPTWKIFRNTTKSTQKATRTPRLRYNRTPVRQTVGGEWALRQCEEHTTWVNGILKHKNLPIIGDLRKSIGDGTTLVILTEGVCKKSVPNINEEITNKEDRVHNIIKCLEILGQSGVDLTAIDGEDLADGNLKSTLMLVGNIRQHFEKEQNYAAVNQTGHKDIAMPGAVTLPGSNDIREQPLGVTDEKNTYQRRIIIPAEDLLPGTMGKEDVRPLTPGLPGMLTSTTEIGMNGVSQSGVEERRQQQVRYSRPQSAKPIPSPKPPPRGHNAWTDNQHAGMPLSVEDRLKSLITGPPAPRPATNNQSFEDGELIQPPPPRPKSAIPFDQSDNRSFNDISSKYGSKSGPFSYIDKPSRPNERWQGSRADALLDRQPERLSLRQTSQDRIPERGVRGQDNPAFMPEMPLNRSRENLGGVPNSRENKGGSELRDAWNKLYGNHVRPESRGPSTYASEAQNQNHPDSLNLHKNFNDHRGIIQNRQDSHAMPNFRPDPHSVPQSRSEEMLNGLPPKSPNYSTNFHVKFPSTPVYNDLSSKPSTSHAERQSPMGQSSSTQGQGSNTSIQYNGNKPHTSHVAFQNFGKSPSIQKLSVSSSPSSPSSPPGIALGPSSKYPDYNEKPANPKVLQTTVDIHNYRKEDDENELLDMKASIFDYHSEPSSRSVTPPLPPLSASNSDYSSDRSSPQISPKLPRSNSATHLSSTKTPDLLTSATRTSGNDKRVRRASGSQFTYRADKKSKQKQMSKHVSSSIKAGILSDVRESGNESDLPFDIEDTILTVDSHDTEPQHMHDALASNDIHKMRDQLNNLEEMYQEVMRQVGSERDIGTVRSRRRWSLGSSDTSSIQRPVSRKFKSATASQRQHHHHHRDIKAINRRFQRLESHVVTLARSVAHLSSELRSHNSVTHDMDMLRKEIQELREEQFIAGQKTSVGNFYGNEFERFRGWVPSLTNPRRVNKLTKFFGQEPPLLNIFLKKLGYEKYSINFEKEHIGMIELPYMTEERLEKIGIPMGPRLRIIQEAQLCFRQENFNIYIV